MDKLFHYCVDDDQHFLVYEFAPRGSLENILYGWFIIICIYKRCSFFDIVVMQQALPWAQRIRIGVGVARGLCYLHKKNLMHYMITSNSVSVFDDGTVKITDTYLFTQSSTVVSSEGSDHGDPMKYV